MTQIPLQTVGMLANLDKPWADPINHNYTANGLNAYDERLYTIVQRTGDPEMVAYAQQVIQQHGMGEISQGVNIAKMGQAWSYYDNRGFISTVANSFGIGVGPASVSPGSGIMYSTDCHYNSKSSEETNKFVDRFLEHRPNHLSGNQARVWRYRAEMLAENPVIKNDPMALTRLEDEIRTLKTIEKNQNNAFSSSIKQVQFNPSQTNDLPAILFYSILQGAAPGNNIAAQVATTVQGLVDAGFDDFAEVIKVQFAQAQEFQQMAFDEISAKLSDVFNELEKTNYGISLLVENMLVQQNKERAQARKDAIKAKFEYSQAISSALVVFANQSGKTSLIQLAKAADSVTHGLAPTIYQLTNVLLKKDLLAIVGTCANLSVAVFELAKIFLSKPGPSFEQLCLQELRAIRADIDELRKENNANFAQVFEQLNLLFREVERGFRDTLYEIRISTKYMVSYLQRVESRLILLGRQTSVGINAFWLRDLERTIHEIDNFESRQNGLQGLDEPTFNKYCNTLYAWLCHEAGAPISSGECLYSRRNGDEIDHEILTGDQQHDEQDVEYLTGFLSGQLTALGVEDPFKTKFNPAIWSRAATHYFRLREKVPEAFVTNRDPSKQELQKVVDHGKAILDFYADIQSNSNLFSALFRTYEERMRTLLTAYQTAIQEAENVYLHNGLETETTRKIRLDFYDKYNAHFAGIDVKTWSSPIGFQAINNFKHREPNNKIQDIAEVDAWNELITDNGLVSQYFRTYLDRLREELGYLQQPLQQNKTDPITRPLVPFISYPLTVDQTLFLPASLVFSSRHFTPPLLPIALMQAERLGLGQFTFQFGPRGHYSYNTFDLNCRFRTTKGEEFPVFQADLRASNPNDPAVTEIRSKSDSTSGYGQITDPFVKVTYPTVVKVNIINAWVHINNCLWKLDQDLDQKVQKLQKDYREEYDRFRKEGPEPLLNADQEGADHHQLVDLLRPRLLALDNVYRLIHTFSRIAGFEHPVMERVEELYNGTSISEHLSGTGQQQQPLNLLLTGWLTVPNGQQRAVIQQSRAAHRQFVEIKQEVLKATEYSLNRLVVQLNPTHHSLYTLLEQHLPQVPTQDIVAVNSLGAPPPKGVLNALYDHLFFISAGHRYEADSPSSFQIYQGKYEGYYEENEPRPRAYYFRGNWSLAAGAQDQLIGLSRADLCAQLLQQGAAAHRREWLSLEIATLLLAQPQGWASTTQTQKDFMTRAGRLQVSHEAYFQRMNKTILANFNYRSKLSLPFLNLMLMNLYNAKVGTGRPFDFRVTDLTVARQYREMLTSRFYQPGCFVEDHPDRLVTSLDHLMTTLRQNPQLRNAYNELVNESETFWSDIVRHCSSQSSLQQFVEHYLSITTNIYGILTVYHFRERMPKVLLWRPNQSTLTAAEKIAFVELLRPSESFSADRQPEQHILWRPAMGYQFAALTPMTRDKIEPIKGLQQERSAQQREKNQRLLVAAREGNHANVLAACLEGAQFFARDPEDGYSALAYAAMGGHVTILEYLCDRARESRISLTRLPTYRVPFPRHANFYTELFQLLDFAVNRGDFTPLMLAARHGQSVERLLQEDPESLHATNSVGLSAVMLACLYGHRGTTLALLNQGASSEYLLEIAAARGHHDLLRHILARLVNAQGIPIDPLPSTEAMAVYLGSLPLMKVFSENAEFIAAISADTGFAIGLPGVNPQSKCTLAMLSIRRIIVDSEIFS